MNVCVILLNQTTNEQVRQVLDPLFDLIPTPEKCVSVPAEEIASLIKRTGFQNVKSQRIQKMSQKWIDGFSHPSELPGIGKYGLESWEIFINGNRDIDPSDKKLRLWLLNHHL